MGAFTLEHLRWRLDKVPHHVGAVEAGVVGGGHQVVDTVAELVEQRDDLVVLEQRRLGRRGFGEVAHQRGGRVAALAIAAREAGLQIEVGRVAVLAVARVQVHVQPAHERLLLGVAGRGLLVVDAELLGVRVPDVLAGIRHLNELEAEQGLEDAEHAANRVVQREVFGHLLVVELEFRFQQVAVIVPACRESVGWPAGRSGEGDIPVVPEKVLSVVFETKRLEIGLL